MSSKDIFGHLKSTPLPSGSNLFKTVPPSKQPPERECRECGIISKMELRGRERRGRMRWKKPREILFGDRKNCTLCYQEYKLRLSRAKNNRKDRRLIRIVSDPRFLNSLAYRWEPSLQAKKGVEIPDGDGWPPGVYNVPKLLREEVEIDGMSFEEVENEILGIREYLGGGPHMCPNGKFAWGPDGTTLTIGNERHVAGFGKVWIHYHRGGAKMNRSLKRLSYLGISREEEVERIKSKIMKRIEDRNERISSKIRFLDLEIDHKKAAQDFFLRLEQIVEARNDN